MEKNIGPLKIIELREAVDRARGLRPTLPQDIQYGVGFWLQECEKVGLGNDPYVMEIRGLYDSRKLPDMYKSD